MATQGALAGYSKAFAPYPSVGYPISNFTGTGGPGNSTLGGLSSSPPQAVSRVLPGVAQHHAVVAILAVVLGGYVIWHLAQRS